ncbi:alpha-1,2-fucosyltransferase [Mucilaginibacter dorajii]|uniref:Alpha-1,2-fucosyltransferase n=1 Tax=Mucilaginibacter dorajii TaxID=692994 RepID=A0ABP7Q2V2_9SPHI|nr:alpha-1,2-fucosyltransferase [Mucilaginibacter dorajii]MCS3732758.1 hypothetical protein [Mucilaginibacter dorajii]
MIGVKLQGRLGNQLFQFAFGYATAKKLNTSCFFDQADQKQVIQNYFELPYNRSFFLDDRIFGISGYRNFFSYRLRNFYYRLIHKYFIFNKVEFKVEEQFDQVAALNKDKTLFEGYFQSERYFTGYEDAIRKHFNVKADFRKRYHQKYDTLFANKTIVTVHIRQDDYKNLGHLNLGSDDLSLPISYYKNIIARISSTNTLFVFISDDVDLVKKEFDYLPYKLISEDDMINDFQHLLNADICVIANSTFSWWGAWLNQKPEKKIYAPKYFLGHHIQKTWPPEIYPDGWQLLDVNNNGQQWTTMDNNG